MLIGAGAVPALRLLVSVEWRSRRRGGRRSSVEPVVMATSQETTATLTLARLILVNACNNGGDVFLLPQL